MTENSTKSNSPRSKSYLKFMLIILIFVAILDLYSTSVQPLIADQVANAFFPTLTSDEQNSILQFGNAIVSIGLYVIFFIQYLADKIGRKITLAITVLGMGLAASGMFIASNYLMYVAFWFLLNFFMHSDIWLIYVNEEAKRTKRATLSNLILAGGLIGGFLLFVFRFIFIPEGDPDPFWRGMFLFPMILGITVGIVILATFKETLKYKEAKEEIKQNPRNFMKDVMCCFEIEAKTSYKFMILATFIFMASSTAYIGIKIKYIENVGFSSLINLVVLVSSFAVLIAIILNALSDRLGRKRLAYLWAILLPISIILLVVSGEILNSSLLVLLSNTINVIAFYGMWGILRLVTLELLPNDRRGTGTGLRQLSSAIGGTTGMATSAIIIELGVPTGIVFIIFSCLALLIVPIIMLKVKETKGVNLSLIK